MFLFVKRGTEKQFKKDISPYLITPQTLIDVVHPEFLKRAKTCQRQLSGREALKIAINKFLNRLLLRK